jgi:predicted DCC family thiol-disulfide oxidoreductase YuxK
MTTATITPPVGYVLYDGLCPLCQKSIAILKRLDWFRKLVYHDARDVAHLPPSPQPLVPKRLIEEMHYVPTQGTTVTAGFAAFRDIAWHIPMVWPLLPFLYLPGVPWIGQKVYLWVAKNRFNLVPCHDGVCGVPRPLGKSR